MSEQFSKWGAAEHLQTLEDARLDVQLCAEEDWSGYEMVGS